MHPLHLLSTLFVLFTGVYSIGQDKCVTFTPSSSSSASSPLFPVVSKGKPAPILVSSDDWPGVQRAVADFADDIQRVTGKKPEVLNVTSTNVGDLAKLKGVNPIIVGTLGKSTLLAGFTSNSSSPSSTPSPSPSAPASTSTSNSTTTNSTDTTTATIQATFDTSSIQGQWESFKSQLVKNPIQGVDEAFVIVGADKRGTIFALYDLSEQFGVSPWYFWADVPPHKHSEIYLSPEGCSHGSPTVKYRGIFLNDEQPALQNWAMEKFTNGTGSVGLGSPFNSKFYEKLFELILRMKANYLWPAMWGSAFALDDPQNQPLADMFGVVMGTSHQEPMMRATPNEFSLLQYGAWDWTTNQANITKYFQEGAERAKGYESVFTIGMRGFGDLPLSENENIGLLQGVVDEQTKILTSVFQEQIQDIPQIWTLYQEVEGYYDDGMKVPDYVTLLWTDDNWGNIRRFPATAERNRTGGAGVYYHVDFVGPPRDYKWITSSQIPKIYEQMSIAVDKSATRVWVLNVGDLKPYERETEFFINYGWNATRWNPDNLDSYVDEWAEREFGLEEGERKEVVDIVANLTRFNARRKPELLNSTTFSLINYRESDRVIDAWKTLADASTKIYNKLSSDMKPAFFQLIHHPVSASANLANMLVSAGLNNMRGTQARYSVNQLADDVVNYFEHDYDFEEQYHTMLGGKWDHMMDQTHVGYYYWQQPMANTMPLITRFQSRKQALPGVMRIVPEGTLGAWPGDNPNQCAQGYNCPPPTVTLDNFDVFGSRYIDVGSGGPASFTFTATTNATWLTLSSKGGSISTKNPEQRVFASVNNWGSLANGPNYAVITFTATASKQPPLTVQVTFVATKNSLAGGFKGFVEGDKTISIEAAHSARNSTVNGMYWRTIPNYGRTVSGVTPWPRLGNNDANFTAGSGPSLEYDFYTFNTLANNTISVTTLLTPSLNSGERSRPMAFAIQVDDQTPVVSHYFPPAVPGGFPAQWGGNDGFAANNIISVTTKFNAAPGAHTLKLYAVEPAVVVQKFMIDAGGLKPSYLGPPESKASS